MRLHRACADGPRLTQGFLPRSGCEPAGPHSNDQMSTRADMRGVRGSRAASAGDAEGGATAAGVQTPFARSNLAHACLLDEGWLRRVQGPTLTMKIHEYALIRDVAAAQPRPRQPDSLWAAPPLVVLNSFGGQEELKLATVLFQNLFPAINVQTTRLSQCQVRLHACSFSYFSVCSESTNATSLVARSLGRSSAARNARSSLHMSCFGVVC